MNGEIENGRAYILNNASMVSVWNIVGEHLGNMVRGAKGKWFFLVWYSIAEAFRALFTLHPFKRYLQLVLDKEMSVVMKFDMDLFCVMRYSLLNYDTVYFKSEDGKLMIMTQEKEEETCEDS